MRHDNSKPNLEAIGNDTGVDFVVFPNGGILSGTGFVR